MRRLFRILLTLLVLIVAGTLGFIYSGAYDVAATAPHWSIVTRLIQTALVRSIKAHAAGLEPPPGFPQNANLAVGVAHYAAHCAVCHGAPGVSKGEIAEGLNPQPPNLARAAAFFTPAELFWIVKNGIKMTGMPAWNDHTDDELWNIVAFLEKLPAMTPQDYAAAVAASKATNDHDHQGADGAANPQLQKR